MLKNNNDKERKYGVDYILEDGTELYEMDWNGEIYSKGYNNGKDTTLIYRPVYKQEENDIFEIIGFEESF